MRPWLIVASILGSYACSSDDKTASSDKLVLNGAATGAGDATSEGGDTKSLSVAVFGLYASPNQDCSNAIKIFENEEGEYMDFLSEPKLGEGDIAAGEYPCVMIGMMDTLKFVPGANAPDVCTEGQEYEMDVCREGSFSSTPTGDRTECNGEINKVWLHVSTLSQATGEQGAEQEAACGDDYAEKCGTFDPPSEDKPYRGLKLGQKLKIAAATQATFVVNGAGRVVAEQGQDGGENAALQCGMQPPAMSFE